MSGALNKPPKQRRFVTLDALRGAGAICVMAGHFGLMEGYSPPSFRLAVDMFFVLSGFVLAHVYDTRFASGLTKREFIQARVLRLYPIYLIGLVLGVCSIFFFNPHFLNMRTGTETTLLALFALPTFPLPPYRALFPLNGPFWSLFFEFWVANLGFAIFWKSLRGSFLAALIGCSAIALAIATVRYHTMDFGSDWDHVIPGIPRVCFSFFAGVAIARVHAAYPPRVKVPSLLCLAIFTAVMVAPARLATTPLFELAVVLLGFPALIYWGTEARERNPAFGTLIGNVSYDIYAIHRPLLYMMIGPLSAVSFVHSKKGNAIIIEAIMMIAVGLIAWITSRFLAAQESPQVSEVGKLKSPPAFAGGKFQRFGSLALPEPQG